MGRREEETTQLAIVSMQIAGITETLKEIKTYIEKMEKERKTESSEQVEWKSKMESRFAKQDLINAGLGVLTGSAITVLVTKVLL